MNQLPTFKCRCSAIGRMMSESRSNPQLTEKQTLRLIELEAKETLSEKQQQEMAELLVKKQNSTKVILSDTCIEMLMEWYAWETQGMVSVAKEFELDSMRKGKLGEQDAILLLSKVEGEIYYKNEERISNDYLTGEPDVFLGDNIIGSRKITDIKNAFDYPIFLKYINSGHSNGEEWQVKGYLDIANCPEGEIARCLVDMPQIMQQDMKKKLFYKGEYVTEMSPEFLEKWEKLERSMNFGMIPEHQRVHRTKIEPFTEFERNKVYEKVKICREWLNNFHEKYTTLVN